MPWSINKNVLVFLGFGVSHHRRSLANGESAGAGLTLKLMQGSSGSPANGSCHLLQIPTTQANG